jgi:hypothetical protein
MPGTCRFVQQSHVFPDRRTPKAHHKANYSVGHNNKFKDNFNQKPHSLGKTLDSQVKAAGEKDVGVHYEDDG